MAKVNGLGWRREQAGFDPEEQPLRPPKWFWVCLVLAGLDVFWQHWRNYADWV